MAGSTVYFNFTSFLRMLFSSRMKLGSGFVFVFATFCKMGKYHDVMMLHFTLMLC